MIERASFLIVLACKHELTFTVAPPMIDEEVWCFRCSRMSKVESAPTEWRIRCTRCPYSRMMGAARLGAEIAASKHVNKRQHPVKIYNGRRLVYTVGERDAQEDAQEVLPGMHEQPPF